MANITGNKKLSITPFTRKDIKEIVNSCCWISPKSSLGLVGSNSPVLVWDDEDEDGNPFLPVFGYAMGMGITRENGELEIIVYTPENGNCLQYKKGVEVPTGYLPEVLAKLDTRFIVGKIIGIDRNIELAHVITDDDSCYDVPLSNIVCADNVKLGLEVIRTYETKENSDNEV